MSERQSGTRNPDKSTRGDANIIDFIAQQQGAADLTDFALKSNAGANLAGVAVVDGAPAVALSPLVDASGYITDGTGTLSTSNTVVDPDGDNTSLVLTPGGIFTEMEAQSPTFTVPDANFVRITGGVFHHRVSNDVKITYYPFWFDAGGGSLPVIDNSNLNAYVTVDTTNTDTWIEIDDYLPVPDGATQMCLVFLVEIPGAAAALQATALTYVNGFQVSAPSVFTGVHSGLVSRRAAWWLPWGTVPGCDVTVGTAQTGIASGTTALTNLTATFTAIANRRYKISFNPGNVSSISAASAWAFELVKDAAFFRILGWVSTSQTNGGAGGFTTDTPTAGSHTYSMQAVRTGGAASFTLGGSGALSANLLIEDVGPVGGPPEDLQ